MRPLFNWGEHWLRALNVAQVPSRVGHLFLSIASLLQGLPSNGQLVLPAFLFHASLIALVALYSAFWLRLNLLQTLPLLAVLALVLSVSGYFLLSQLSALRLKQS